MDYNVIIIISFLYVVDVLTYFPRSPSDSLFVYITVWDELALLAVAVFLLSSNLLTTAPVPLIIAHLGGTHNSDLRRM